MQPANHFHIRVIIVYRMYVLLKKRRSLIETTTRDYGTKSHTILVFTLIFAVFVLLKDR